MSVPSLPSEPSMHLPWKRIVLLLLVVVGVVLLGLAVIAWIQVRRAPSWWIPMEPADAALADVGRGLENRVPTVLSELRPGATAAERAKPWRILLPSSQANAWLATRLGPWLENRGYAIPKGFEQVQVHFDDHTIVIGAQITRPNQDPLWLSATLKPEVKTDGSLWLAATALSIGRVGLPPSIVLDESGSPGSIASMLGKLPANVRDNPDVRKVMMVLMGKQAAMLDASFALPDGRRVRLLGLDGEEGKLAITLTTSDPVRK